MIRQLAFFVGIFQEGESHMERKVSFIIKEQEVNPQRSKVSCLYDPMEIKAVDSEDLLMIMNRLAYEYRKQVKDYMSKQEINNAISKYVF